MTNNQDAMKCAHALTARSIDQKLDQLDNDAAAHIRRLVAENEAMLVGLRNRDDWLEQKSKRLIAATALMQQMLEAGKELNRFYSHIWDRVDGCAVIFPNSIPAFENAVEKHGEAITAASEWLGQKGETQ